MSDEIHMHSRWSKERYKTAQASLVSILRGMNANGPASAILRPTLRDEARKSIGDTGACVLPLTGPSSGCKLTCCYVLHAAVCSRMVCLQRGFHFAVLQYAAGLLDHLLKHATDATVTEEGHRLRRRHNRDGHMEYWLALPNATDAGCCISRPCPAGFQGVVMFSTNLHRNRQLTAQLGSLASDIAMLSQTAHRHSSMTLVQTRSYCRRRLAIWPTRWPACGRRVQR